MGPHINIGKQSLTHWGWAMHICISKLTITGSDNGLSLGWRQAIVWTNAGILLIRTLGTNFSEIFSKIRIFSFKKMHSKISSVKWGQFCLSLDVLNHHIWYWQDPPQHGVWPLNCELWSDWLSLSQCRYWLTVVTWGSPWHPHLIEP